MGAVEHNNLHEASITELLNYYLFCHRNTRRQSSMSSQSPTDIEAYYKKRLYTQPLQESILIYKESVALCSHRCLNIEKYEKYSGNLYYLKQYSSEKASYSVRIILVP